MVLRVLLMREYMIYEFNKEQELNQPTTHQAP